MLLSFHLYFMRPCKSKFSCLWVQLSCIQPQLLSTDHYCKRCTYY